MVNKINDRMKMYEKGYNAALVDIAELVAIIKQRYLDVLKCAPCQKLKGYAVQLLMEYVKTS